MCEEDIESVHLRSAADSEPTRLQHGRLLTHFLVNEMYGIYLTTFYFFYFRGSRASLAVLEKSPLLGIAFGF